MSVLMGAALACAAGGVLPWISSEAAVAAAVLLLPAGWRTILVVACALGQIAAKSGLYGLARWAPHRLPARALQLAARADRYRDRRWTLAVTIFTGALVGLPPFYLVTLACGILRVPFVLYALAGVAGTLLRYTTVARAAVALGAP
jgi:membrane protein YqaA with SNARE-associated domain